jgi:hypothetical protein
MGHEIVERLRNLLKEHKEDGWHQMLLDSIVEARNRAIEAGLRGAEDFPVDLDSRKGYFVYLEKMVEWIPREDYEMSGKAHDFSRGMRANYF